jgi:starch synthase
MNEKMSIFTVASEAIPYAKTGGLADVAGTLPSCLTRAGADLFMVLPYYRGIRKMGLPAVLALDTLDVDLGGMVLPSRVWRHEREDGVVCFFIEREDLFDRPNLYGTARGDYYDNMERFSYFCRATLHLLRELKMRPHIIHCHDWQTGLIPALLKGPFSDMAGRGGSRCVFTIHNIGYQGIFPADKISLTGLDKALFFHPEALEYWGRISLLKAGILYSDSVTTVSPTYAKEILTPSMGMGLEGVLAKRRESLRGILNGVDYRVWDPSKDKELPWNYGPGHMEGKKMCKKGLTAEMGLDPEMEKRPLMAMISRMDKQKGFDLLMEVLDHIMDLKAGLVILGEGGRDIEQALRGYSERHKGKMSLTIGFDESLAHRIMGGADIFLIPSRYEPCGLTQMYALKYGTVPLVRSTGGLEDTVVQFDRKRGRGTGFKFDAYSPEAFREALNAAVACFDKPAEWRQVVGNGMVQDFSWNRSAESYMELYKDLIKSGV